MEKQRKQSMLWPYLCMVLKYVFALVFPVLIVVLHGGTRRYIIVALAEVLLIALLTNLLCKINRWVAYAINVVLLALMNAQFVVLFWGGTYTSIIMLTNLDSVQALSGKFLEYGTSVILVAIFSLLPVYRLKIGKKPLIAGCAVSAMLYVLIFVAGMYRNTPFYALYALVRQQVARTQIAAVAKEELNAVDEFYRTEVTDYVEKPAEIVESPNVILIFTEGLSQSVIDDERKIMPNVRALQENSLNFTNYFNHTFATYMGLSGQLYSGYQQNHYDKNNLVSIQDIFRENDYQTTFINTEPKNMEFTSYLENMNFDQVITDLNRLDGAVETMSDKAAYEFLLETALEQNQSGTQFFISMYSFGTHASLDGVHESFGDGTDALLNKFYDLDVSFGAFFEAFRESELAENTVLIFTADHATYQDADFIASFPDYPRASAMMDEIPFVIWYEGVTPEDYDVGGRNSLDLVPTVLDILDMSGENYFLGTSLFSPADEEGMFDTYFESVGIYIKSDGGVLQELSAEEREKCVPVLAKYFAAKLSNETAGLIIYARQSEDGTAIETELYNAKQYESLRYAVWSEENGQDDLVWYTVTGTQEDCIAYSIDLADFNSEGTYYVHVYGTNEISSGTLTGTSTTVTFER